MGNGVATTLPLACARYLGCHASHVKLGATDEFNTLKLVSEFCTTQAQLDKVAANPRFTPEINMSTAASAGAYQQRHAVLQASQILFHKSIIPAAKNLWKNEKIEIEKLKWENGQLNYPGLPSLSFSILVDNIFKQKRIISVMAHCYYQAQWAKATFEFEGSQSSFPIDALAIKYPEKEYQLLNRISVEFPPVNSSWGGEDVFSACGALCHLSVDQKTGNVSVKEFHSFLDCGPPTNKPIVEGQAQGAIVMGIGQTLFEDFPMYEGGPGCGQWNFHKYHVPIANDFPQLQLEVHLIPPLSPNEEPKGIAEVVLNPISPAIANAIAHATGKRFRELPILPQKIVEAMS
jgi:CO/xanthine dehydrogenase Mo-binding subunit